MRRGDVWMVDFSFPTGTEAAYRRPAVVASNDSANQSATTLGRGVVTVVPVTGNVRMAERDCDGSVEAIPSTRFPLPDYFFFAASRMRRRRSSAASGDSR